MKLSRQCAKRAASAICFGLAAAVLLMMTMDVLLPRTDHYTSAHPASPLPQMMGFDENSLVNAGDANALDKLPGVGEVISQRIIETRDLLGGYKFPGDLLLVKGIGEKTYEKIMKALEEPLVVLPELPD